MDISDRHSQSDFGHSFDLHRLKILRKVSIKYGNSPTEQGTWKRSRDTNPLNRCKDKITEKPSFQKDKIPFLQGQKKTTHARACRIESICPQKTGET